MNKELLFRAQRVAALVFAVFLVLHLGAVAASLGGADGFDTGVRATRAVYGYLPLELLLLAALLLHIGVSIYIWKRRPPGARRTFTQQLQSWAALLLLVFIGGHVLFLRIAPAVWHFTADYMYLWMAYRIWPTLFVPLYLLLAVAGAYHLFFGLRQFALRRPEKTWHRVALAVVVGFFIVVTLRLPFLAPQRELSDAELHQYLAPYAKFTPWLIDMADEHPFIRRYEGLPPLTDD